MHKLFSLSFKRIASRLNNPELNALNVAEALQNNNIGSSGEPFLYRLPRDELKHILNISCPINSYLVFNLVSKIPVLQRLWLLLRHLDIMLRSRRKKSVRSVLLDKIVSQLSCLLRGLLKMRPKICWYFGSGYPIWPNMIKFSIGIGSQPINLVITL